MKGLIAIIFCCGTLTLCAQFNNGGIRSSLGLFYATNTYALDHLASRPYVKDFDRSAGIKYSTMVSKHVILAAGGQYCKTVYKLADKTNCPDCAERLDNIYLDFFQQAGLVWVNRKNVFITTNIGFAWAWRLSPDSTLVMVPGAFSRNIHNIMIETNMSFRITKGVFLQLDPGCRYFLEEIEVAYKNSRPKLWYCNIGLSFIIDPKGSKGRAKEDVTPVLDLL